MKGFAVVVGAGTIMGLAACGLLRLEFSREVNYLVGRGLICIPEAEMPAESILRLLYILSRAKRFA